MINASKDNILLSLLSAGDLEAVTRRGAVVDLVLGHDLAVAGEPISYCWFPLSGLVSVIAEDSDGKQAEIGIIGYEGMVNGDVATGSRQSAMRILVQISGQALRVDVRNVVNTMSASESFLKLVAAYNHALAIQAGFSALAYAQYPIEQRLARWSLMCADRVGDDRIDLTHEALSIMLGVRRAGVSVALHALAVKGALLPRRGGQSIGDRAILALIAGAGYGTAEAEYERMMQTAFPVARSLPA